jgi:hypothetical protein
LPAEFIAFVDRPEPSSVGPLLPSTEPPPLAPFVPAPPVPVPSVGLVVSPPDPVIPSVGAEASGPPVPLTPSDGVVAGVSVGAGVGFGGGVVAGREVGWGVASGAGLGVGFGVGFGVGGGGTVIVTVPPSTVSLNLSRLIATNEIVWVPAARFVDHLLWTPLFQLVAPSPFIA